MPRYRVLTNCWLNDRYYKADDIVDFDGPPGRALQLIDKPAAPAPAADPQIEPEKPIENTSTPQDPAQADERASDAEV